jgi:hypothetical protein
MIEPRQDTPYLHTRHHFNTLLATVIVVDMAAVDPQPDGQSREFIRPERNEVDSHSASVGDRAAESRVAGRQWVRI